MKLQLLMNVALATSLGLASSATVDHGKQRAEVEVSVGAGATLPDFLTDASNGLDDTMKTNLEKRNSRFEAALGIWISSSAALRNVAFAYQDVLRRLVSWRLADPNLCTANCDGVNDWTDAVAQMFQLPGASTDPATSNLAGATVKPLQFITADGPTKGKLDLAANGGLTNSQNEAFSSFNPTRTGNVLDITPEKKNKDFKYATPALALADREKAVKTVLDMLIMSPSELTGREVLHVISRATECGETLYEKTRESLYAQSQHPAVEDDKFFQQGCLRWVIRQAFKDWDKKPAGTMTANTYGAKLVEKGFSIDHLNRQYLNVYAPNPANNNALEVVKDDNLIKKGWLSPLAASVCRTARPSGGKMVVPANTQRTKGTTPVFRFQPPVPKGDTDLSQQTIVGLGMKPLSVRELTYVQHAWDYTDAAQPLPFGVGGRFWLINGNYDPATDAKASPNALNFLGAVHDQLMNSAAGPSGTTDEYLQPFDYAGLTQSAQTDFYLLNGLLGCTGNMALYYHHSYFETLNGAGAGYDGKNLVNRNFNYDTKDPFGWLENVPAKPTSFCKMTYLFATEPETAPTFAITDAAELHDGDFHKVTLEEVEDVYIRLHKQSNLAVLLDKTDYPNEYNRPLVSDTVDAAAFEKMKGPHKWHEDSEAEVDYKKFEALCAANKITSKVYKFELCDAYQYVDWTWSGKEDLEGKFESFAVSSMDAFIVGERHGLSDKYEVKVGETLVVSFKSGVAVNVNSVEVNFNEILPNTIDAIQFGADEDDSDTPAAAEGAAPAAFKRKRSALKGKTRDVTFIFTNREGVATPESKSTDGSQAVSGAHTGVTSIQVKATDIIDSFYLHGVFESFVELTVQGPQAQPGAVLQDAAPNAQVAALVAAAPAVPAAPAAANVTNFKKAASAVIKKSGRLRGEKRHHKSTQQQLHAKN